jgi:hypothetical protein
MMGIGDAPRMSDDGQDMVSNGVGSARPAGANQAHRPKRESSSRPASAPNNTAHTAGEQGWGHDEPGAGVRSGGRRQTSTCDAQAPPSVPPVDPWKASHIALSALPLLAFLLVCISLIGGSEPRPATDQARLGSVAEQAPAASTAPLPARPCRSPAVAASHVRPKPALWSRANQAGCWTAVRSRRARSAVAWSTASATQQITLPSLTNREEIRLPRIAPGCGLRVMPIQQSRRASRPTGRQGLLDDELPLRPDLSIAPERLQSLSLTLARKDVQQACCCIVANTIFAHWNGAKVHYSRDNTFYAAVRASAPSWFSRRVIVAAVDQLVACGLLEEWRTSPSPSAKYRSRLSATPKLIEAIGVDNVSGLSWRRTPPVILRC